MVEENKKYGGLSDSEIDAVVDEILAFRKDVEKRDVPLVIVGQGDNQRCIMPNEVKTTNIFLLLCDRQANRRSLISVCRSFLRNLINRMKRLFS